MIVAPTAFIAVPPLVATIPTPYLFGTLIVPWFSIIPFSVAIPTETLLIEAPIKDFPTVIVALFSILPVSVYAPTE